MYIGNPPVAMSDVTTHDIVQLPVSNIVKTESNTPLAYQVETSDPVKMELDPAYHQVLSSHSKTNRSVTVQDSVSHTVKAQANQAYPVVTSDKVKNDQDPAYQGLSKILQDPISDEAKMEFNAHFLVTSDQVKQGPDPAYQVISSHSKSGIQDGPVSNKVKMDSDPAEQTLTSCQDKLGPDPAYQQFIN